MAKDTHKYYVNAFKTKEQYNSKRPVISGKGVRHISYSDAEKEQEAHIESGAFASVIVAVKDNRSVSDMFAKNAEFAKGGGVGTTFNYTIGGL